MLPMSCVAEISRETPSGNRMRELAKRLERDDIRMTASKDGKQIQFQHEGSAYKMSGSRLGRGFTANGLAVRLGMDMANQLRIAAEREPRLSLVAWRTSFCAAKASAKPMSSCQLFA